MRRKVICLVVVAAALIAGCATCPADRACRLVRPGDVVVPPYVAAIDAGSATIMWETAKRSRNLLVVRHKGIVSTQKTAMASVHCVTFTNLCPGVQYQCSLAGSAKARCKFIMPGKKRQYYAFGIAGDNRSDPDAFSGVCRAMAHAGLDFVVHTGDIVENGTKREQWYSQWFKPTAPLMRKMPVLVAWGNHEQPANRESWVHAYYPDRSPFIGSSWYSFVQGPVRFVMLDNYQPLEPGSIQYAWLERTLAASREPFVIAAFHVSPYTDSAHAQDAQVKQTRREIVPLFLRHNVNLVVTGHDHLYERSKYGGTTFIIAGGAGAPLYQPQISLNPYLVTSTSAYHYLIADVSPTQITCEVYSTPGHLIDSFAVQPRRIDAPKPDALATFDPPRRDYLDRETFAWAVDPCNLSTGFVTGTVKIDAPADWLVQPGRALDFFVARDESLTAIPCRAWPRSPKPGLYPVTTTVCFNDATNTMTCTLEVLGTEPVKAEWDFSGIASSLCWSNAVAATIGSGMWHSVSTTSAMPVLYAAMPGQFDAGDRDIAYIRMRLSGTNIVTALQSFWSCRDADGETQTIEFYDYAAVNGQWYTYVAYLGREHLWRGRALGVQIMPVADPDVTIEIDTVRVCAPPAPAAVAESRPQANNPLSAPDQPSEATK